MLCGASLSTVTLTLQTCAPTYRSLPPHCNTWQSCPCALPLRLNLQCSMKSNTASSRTSTSALSLLSS